MLTRDRIQTGELTAEWDGTGTEVDGSTLAISQPGMGSVTCQLSGTFDATVTFEVTNETGASPAWVDVHAMQLEGSGSGTAAKTTTATGLYAIPVAGFQRFRVRCSAYASGTVSVVLLASPALTRTDGMLLIYNATSDQINFQRSASSLTDASAGGTLQPVGGILYNGATWDRERNTYEGTAYASAARTATPSATDITTYNAKGITVVLDATAASATPSVVLTIDGKDSLSGKYYNILTGAAVTGVSTNKYVVALGATVAANAVVSHPLPRVIRIVATHADSDSITYSVGYTLHS